MKPQAALLRLEVFTTSITATTSITPIKSNLHCSTYLGVLTKSWLWHFMLIIILWLWLSCQGSPFFIAPKSDHCLALPWSVLQSLLLLRLRSSKVRSCLSIKKNLWKGYDSDFWQNICSKYLKYKICRYYTKRYENRELGLSKSWFQKKNSQLLLWLRPHLCQNLSSKITNIFFQVLGSNPMDQIFAKSNSSLFSASSFAFAFKDGSVTCRLLQ